jgi:predicted Zn-dependent protease
VTLDPPDSHHLSAAIGWLELGNAVEADAELEKISAELRLHPDVLEVVWAISSKSKDWERCIETAQQLTKTAPEREWGWIHLSYALHELKRTQEAYDNLIPVLPKFPTDWLMRYNLACYAAQLGLLDEAERWLGGAMLMGDRKEIKAMAKDDPDLAPLFVK